MLVEPYHMLFLIILDAHIDAFVLSAFVLHFVYIALYFIIRGTEA